jgi:signal transduction histidine kinase
VTWRPTIRLRLTLLYGGLFFFAGSLLLGATYRAVVQALPLSNIERQIEQLQGRTGNDRQLRILEAQLKERKEALVVVRNRARWSLLFVSVGAMTLGWFVAGKMLKPIRTITEHARLASTDTLGNRIALRGPPDELHDLADTIDGMLDRIETSYESQRQFSARVSHELRTPLALLSTAADSSLSKPDGDHQLAGTVKQAVERSERLIAGLLTLAKSESSRIEYSNVDLADLAGSSLEQFALQATRARIEIREPRLESVVVRAEPVLLEQCFANLVDNAIRYNNPGGWLQVFTTVVNGIARFSVENSGPVVAPGDISVLFAPYQRGTFLQVNDSPGYGLGLAIVRSIANAHGASIDAFPRDEGGLSIEIAFPPVSPE